MHAAYLGHEVYRVHYGHGLNMTRYEVTTRGEDLYVGLTLRDAMEEYERRVQVSRTARATYIYLTTETNSFGDQVIRVQRIDGATGETSIVPYIQPEGSHQDAAELLEYLNKRGE